MTDRETAGFYFPCIFRDWQAVRTIVSPEQGWRLFLRCLDYAQGKEPEPDTDPIVTAFFELISGGIDRSISASDEKRRKSRYARYCGITKNSGNTPLNYEQWLIEVDGRQQSITDADNHNHNHNHNQESTASTKRDAAAQAQPFDKTNENYIPEHWERNIHKSFWGKFQSEDAYYEWAEQHPEEVLSLYREDD